MPVEIVESLIASHGGIAVDGVGFVEVKDVTCTMWLYRFIFKVISKIKQFVKWDK